MLVQPCLLMMRVESAIFSSPCPSTSSSSDSRTARCKPARATGKTRRRRTCLRCFHGTRPDRSGHPRRSGSRSCAAIIQRVAGITLTRPHVGVQVEHLPQPHDRREIDQPFALEFRDQFFLGFVLWLAGDRAEETAGGFLERLHGAIGKRVAFLAPKFPADIAGHILGVEFHRSSTIRAASMTSWPTPSPGIHAILYLAIGSRLYRGRD